MNPLRTIATVLFGALLATAPADAGFVLTYDPFFGSTEATGATSDVTFHFQGSGQPGRTQALLTISNTTGTGSFDPATVQQGAIGATLMGIGFNLPAGVTLVKGTYLDLDGYFPNLLFNVSLRPLGEVHIGIALNRSLQGGNPTGGLAAGEQAHVLFDLDSSPAISPVALESNFLAGFGDGTLTTFARFQNVDGEGSDKVSGGITSAPVPEPASLFAFGMGMVLFGADGVLRRRKRAVGLQQRRTLAP